MRQRSKTDPVTTVYRHYYSDGITLLGPVFRARSYADSWTPSKDQIQGAIPKIFPFNWGIYSQCLNRSVSMLDDPSLPIKEKSCESTVSHDIDSAVGISHAYLALRKTIVNRDWENGGYTYQPYWSGTATSFGSVQDICNANKQAISMKLNQMHALPSFADLVPRALRAALPDNPEISSLNFIWELKDFRNLSEGIKDLGQCLRYGHPSSIGQLLEEFARKYGLTAKNFRSRLQLISPSKFNKMNERAKQIARLFSLWADAHLTWSFALAPLANDLATYEAMLHSMKESSREAKKKSNVLTRRESASASSSSDWSEISGYLVGRGTYYRIRIDMRRKVSIKATVTEKLDGIIGSLNSNISRMGLALQPSVIFNAIPLSFLADYISNVGDIIESFDQYTGNFMVSQLHCSSLTELTSYVFEGHFGDGNWTEIGSRTVKNFVRTTKSPWILNPTYMPPPDWSWHFPSSGANSNALALFYNMSTGKYRR